MQRREDQRLRSTSAQEMLADDLWGVLRCLSEEFYALRVGESWKAHPVGCLGRDEALVQRKWRGSRREAFG